MSVWIVAYLVVAFFLMRRFAGAVYRYELRAEQEKARERGREIPTEPSEGGAAAGFFGGLLWPIVLVGILIFKIDNRYPNFWFRVFHHMPRRERRLLALERSRKRTAELERELDAEISSL